MVYRHELKHIINFSDMLSMRQSLSVIAEADKYAEDGSYLVRSLYFDTPTDTALKEKINGVNRREKFRIRFYNHDTSYIRLEKKCKTNGLGYKHSALLSCEEAQRIVDCDYEWMRSDVRELVRELYTKINIFGLAPKTIVDYIREPFIYAPGNVRITFDYNIRTGVLCTDFLNPDCITIPAGAAPIILEVKWDEFLPTVIRNAVQLSNRSPSAFSKYAACRIYG